MYKEQTIAAIKEADISDWGWHIEICEGIHDEYAKGYLNAKAEALSASIGSTDEEFREELLEYCEHDIWKA